MDGSRERDLRPRTTKDGNCTCVFALRIARMTSKPAPNGDASLGGQVRLPGKRHEAIRSSKRPRSGLRRTCTVEAIARSPVPNLLKETRTR